MGSDLGRGLYKASSFRRCAVETRTSGKNSFRIYYRYIVCVPFHRGGQIMYDGTYMPEPNSGTCALMTSSMYVDKRIAYPKFYSFSERKWTKQPRPELAYVTSQMPKINIITAHDETL